MSFYFERFQSHYLVGVLLCKKSLREFLAACGVHEPSAPAAPCGAVVAEGGAYSQPASQKKHPHETLPHFHYDGLVPPDDQVQLRRSGPTGRTTIWSHQTLKCNYDDLAPPDFRDDLPAPPDAQAPLRRSGSTGRSSAIATNWSHRTLKCNYDDLVPPDAQVQLRRSGPTGGSSAITTIWSSLSSCFGSNVCFIWLKIKLRFLNLGIAVVTARFVSSTTCRLKHLCCEIHCLTNALQTEDSAWCERRFSQA